MRLVLASGSPRRRVLLGLLTPDFSVVVPAVDESLPEGDLAGALEAVAVRKARAVADPDAVVLAADTLVEHDGKVLGKAADAEEARAALTALRTSPHRVLTGLAVAAGGAVRTACVATTVSFGVPDAVLEAYLASGAWAGKAGAYGIQDALLAPHLTVTGPWSNVVGLPLAATAGLLRAAGVPVRDPPDEADLRLHNPFLDPVA